MEDTRELRYLVAVLITFNAPRRVASLKKRLKSGVTSSSSSGCVDENTITPPEPA